MTRLTAAAAAILMLSQAAYAAGPEGTWMSEDGGLKVRLSNCGGRLCGRVVWLNEPIDRKTGKLKTDKLNPDPAKRSRPLIGLKVVKGFKLIGRNEWVGTIYNADDGHSYHAYLKVKDAHTARLQGCVFTILCRGHTWTRTN
ncbi:MAG: DUF2147 domain-containing protein [Pseudolabrys sp.]